eukprot:TRINITY_DN2343_c0_g1_i3.p1 TRINITY_DN2343_c0_g1~~TRINITY_DN2343_c0_g1_i3.p1  ORF type:complete len:815 (+),score=258.84 TRINITY_DN2343_c0_g1_i3:237-2681(+)
MSEDELARTVGELRRVVLQQNEHIERIENEQSRFEIETQIAQKELEVSLKMSIFEMSKELQRHWQTALLEVSRSSEEFCSALQDSVRSTEQKLRTHVADRLQELEDSVISKLTDVPDLLDEVKRVEDSILSQCEENTRIELQTILEEQEASSRELSRRILFLETEREQTMKSFEESMERVVKRSHRTEEYVDSRVVSMEKYMEELRAKQDELVKFVRLQLARVQVKQMGFGEDGEVLAIPSGSPGHDDTRRSSVDMGMLEMIRRGSASLGARDGGTLSVEGGEDQQQSKSDVGVPFQSKEEEGGKEDFTSGKKRQPHSEAEGTDVGRPQSSAWSPLREAVRRKELDTAGSEKSKGSEKAEEEVASLSVTSPTGTQTSSGTAKHTKDASSDAESSVKRESGFGNKQDEDEDSLVVVKDDDDADGDGEGKKELESEDELVESVSDAGKVRGKGSHEKKPAEGKQKENAIAEKEKGHGHESDGERGEGKVKSSTKSEIVVKQDDDQWGGADSDLGSPVKSESSTVVHHKSENISESGTPSEKDSMGSHGFGSPVSDDKTAIPLSTVVMAESHAEKSGYHEGEYATSGGQMTQRMGHGHSPSAEFSSARSRHARVDSDDSWDDTLSYSTVSASMGPPSAGSGPHGRFSGGGARGAKTWLSDDVVSDDLPRDDEYSSRELGRIQELLGDLKEEEKRRAQRQMMGRGSVSRQQRGGGRRGGRGSSTSSRQPVSHTSGRSPLQSTPGTGSSDVQYTKSNPSRSGLTPVKSPRYHTHRPSPVGRGGAGRPGKGGGRATSPIQRKGVNVRDGKPVYFLDLTST